MIPLLNSVTRKDVRVVLAAMNAAPLHEGQLQKRTGLGVSRLRQALRLGAQLGVLEQRLSKRGPGSASTEFRYEWMRREACVGNR